MERNARKRTRTEKKNRGLKASEIFGMLAAIGVQPAFLLYEATLFELEAILSQSLEQKKEMYNLARLHATTIVQINTTKRVKPTDIWTFPWDKTQAKPSTRQRFEELAKKYSNKP